MYIYTCTYVNSSFFCIMSLTFVTYYYVKMKKMHYEVEQVPTNQKRLTTMLLYKKASRTKCNLLSIYLYITKYQFYITYILITNCIKKLCMSNNHRVVHGFHHAMHQLYLANCKISQFVNFQELNVIETKPVFSSIYCCEIMSVNNKTFYIRKQK